MSGVGITTTAQWDALMFTPWKWFQAPSGKDGGSWTVFLRCPACGAVTDWRDQELHLRFHGITNGRIITEIEDRQKAEWTG